MKDEEIDKLVAGRPLDILIAMQVMGWTPTASENPESVPIISYISEDSSGSPLHWMVLPCFSTMIQDAWLVVERISKLIHQAEDEIDRNYLMLVQTGHFESESKFVASFSTMANDCEEWYLKQDLPFTARAEAAPLAICRAALKTIKKWAPDPIR